MAQPVDDGPLRFGAIFAEKYEITRLLGRGGQACVYRATHRLSGREVAIKVVHSVQGGVTKEMLDRGKAEAKILGQFDHPNIVRMHDAGFDENTRLFYIVMELLNGRPLRSVLGHYGRLGIEEVLRLGIKIAWAVHEAHKKNILHRDLKPDNIFIVQDSEPKVVDFGIARMLDEIGLTTRRQGVLGTLIYMSPEQAQGRWDLTGQTDIFSLGTVLFEALLGENPTVLIFRLGLAERNEPPRAPAMVDYAPIQVTEIPPLLSQLDDRIPIYIAQAIQRAIAKAAQQRFATMADFAAALQVCLDTYLRDARASSRAPRPRDLSLPAPKVREEPPLSRRETVRQSRTDDIAASIGQQVTDAIKPLAGSSRADGAPSSAFGVETAPLGTSAVSQSQRSPKVELTERSSSPPVSVTRKAKPSQAMARPPLAALWAPDSARQQSVAPAPRSAPASPRTTGPSAESWQGRRALVRGALAVAGVIFGATVGTAGAKAHFAAEDRKAKALPVLAPAMPRVATRTQASDAPTSTPTPEPPVAPPATDAAPPLHNSPAPPLATARATPKSAPVANVTAAKPFSSAKPVDKMEQRLLQVENDFATPQPQPAISANSHAPAIKPLRKAIYGD